jgi:GT2 family glycosyltransferase
MSIFWKALRKAIPEPLEAPMRDFYRRHIGSRRTAVPTAPVAAAVRTAPFRQTAEPAARPRALPLGSAPADPRVSIAIVTWNGWDYTQCCLESLWRTTDPATTEIIVVDNASTDTTARELESLAKTTPNLRWLANDTNRGFAAANNQALHRARGETLVLLNNDTVVPPGWLEMLQAWLEDPRLGLVGPVTNQAGNEARIAVDYEDLAGMHRFAAARQRDARGQSFDIPMLAMFCTAMRRSTWEAVGDLDERFGIGMFEDDDYARRVRTAGLRVLCVEDVFVHHFGGASFATIEPQAYRTLFEANRRRFEAKWGISWEPHRGRERESRPASSGIPRPAP